MSVRGTASRFSASTLRALAMLCVLTASAITDLAAPLAAQGVDPERLKQVRAAFLLNFVRYTEWPASSFSAADSPYFAAVLDDDGVAEALEQLARRTGAIAGRELRVIRLRTPQSEAERASFENLVRRCHLAYLGEKPGRELVATLSAAAVLTVAADAEFLGEGGMIALVIDGNRVTFDVNQVAIRGQGLNLSSRVLQLARRVSREP